MPQGVLESVIPWRDATTGLPRPPLANNRISAISVGDVWHGVDAEWAYTLDDWEPTNIVSASHLISISDRSAAYIDRRTATGYVRRPFPRCTVWICPAGHQFAFRIPGRHWWGTVALPAERIRRVVGQHYELHEVCGLEDHVLYDIVSAILAKVRSGNCNNPLLADSLVTALISQLLDNERCGREVPLGQSLQSEQLRAVFAYVRARLTAPLTVADLARVVGVSDAHFARAFKRETGLTPITYVTQERLKRSQLLISAGRPLTEVAANSGFSDQAHMTRRFVEHFGITPGAFRRRLLEQRSDATNTRLSGSSRTPRCLE